MCLIHTNECRTNAFSISSLKNAVFCKPGSAFDLYNPRWVQGRGRSKVQVTALNLRTYH